MITSPKVLIAAKKEGVKTTVWPSPLLEDFLSTGGFTRLATEQRDVKETKLELERLNLEKARYDVKNAKKNL